MLPTGFLLKGTSEEGLGSIIDGGELLSVLGVYTGGDPVCQSLFGALPTLSGVGAFTSTKESREGLEPCRLFGLRNGGDPGISPAGTSSFGKDGISGGGRALTSLFLGEAGLGGFGRLLPSGIDRGDPREPLRPSSSPTTDGVLAREAIDAIDGRCICLCRVR